MRGRFTFVISCADFLQHYKIDKGLNSYIPNFNASPGQDIPVVLTAGSETVLDTNRWGLIPHWAKDPEIGGRMINARAETMAEKPSSRSSFFGRRCLVIADGFYEWEKEGGAKVPYYVRLKDRPVFGFAGLWDQWKSPEGAVIKSCAIITVWPNEFMKGIHDRMPAILPKSSEPAWLDPENKEKSDLLSLLRPCDSSSMEAYQVSNAVNDPLNNSEDCIKPVPRKDRGLSKFF
ncbi:MAG: SOS response-associated peptidase [Candidatus Aenigmarchaeota archaeon]|nr:SOS response-associated peptidase [Candidatus Aenigmarchaeota archaeon]